MIGSQRILFLCTANSARSQLAEAILRDRAGNRMEACSAGTHPSVVHPLAVEVLQEIQICTDGLWSKSVRDVLREGPVSLTIAVCSSAAENCPAVGGEQVLSWPFDDPAACGEDLETQRQAFRSTRDKASKIDSWLTPRVLECYLVYQPLTAAIAESSSSTLARSTVCLHFIAATRIR